MHHKSYFIPQNKGGLFKQTPSLKEKFSAIKKDLGSKLE